MEKTKRAGVASEPITIFRDELIAAVTAELLEFSEGMEFEGLLRLSADSIASCVFARLTGHAQYQAPTEKEQR